MKLHYRFRDEFAAGWASYIGHENIDIVATPDEMRDLEERVVAEPSAR